MTVRLYRSTDSGAPSVNGTIGAFIGLLDACLVSGYGSSLPAGWSKPFTGTNLGVYRPGSGFRCYMRVDDTAAQFARITAYETMSDVNTGVNYFNSPVTGGHSVTKSNTADTVARGWVVVATEAAVYIFIEPTSTPTTWESFVTSTSGNGQFFFGEFVSYRPGDTSNNMIIGATSTTAGNGQLGTVSFNAVSSGHYLSKNFLGIGLGAVTVGKNVPGLYNSSAAVMGASSTSNPYPDPMTGGVLMAPVELNETLPAGGFIIRGKMPGMWAPITSFPMAHGDIITGTGILAGKTLLAVTVYSTFNAGRAFIEISNTW